MIRPRRGLVRGALLVAVFFAAEPADAQVDDLESVRSRLGQAATTRIAAVIDRSVAAGLPRDLLVGKAIEGASKGMELEVVLAALTSYSDELRVASTVLGGDADSESLERAAEALRRGVDRALLAYLDRETPDDFTLMVVALEDLLELGVEQQLAEDLIRYAASQGLPGNEVLALPDGVRRHLRDGQTPAEAAASVSRALRGGGGRGPFS